MAEIFHNLLDTYNVTLEAFLDKENVLTNVLNKIENVTNVKKQYIANGIVSLFGLYMIFGSFAALVCNAVGFLYPAYQSLNALETVNADDDRKWLTYWVVFAFFSLIEFFADTIFMWFPFYWLAKIVFLVWCFFPIERNGSNVIYSRIIRPYYLKRRDNINDNIEKVKSGLSGPIADKVRKGVSDVFKSTGGDKSD
ncbi:receptor expression-enhancing protein 5-like [Panonychus citri]|uniref:receptor expression-enhancing protein 5-like n=1 Tax=Panonychus citri TaxID=50023 RepID=UPI002306ECBA|nr:receptor expression-enhancing protein 5-like [Panonychus citri]XP_053208956.1 receptor expression-enhancing protein 5-like [Panonychus citri]XP_053208964.1 receptor expression-enhancing protein 5-like [Panonychus citri]